MKNKFRLTMLPTLLILSACVSSPPKVVEAPHFQVPPAPKHRPIPGDQALSDWDTCLKNSLQHCETHEKTSANATPSATR
jgi:hypothetical protein